MRLLAHLGTNFERNAPLPDIDYQYYTSLINDKVAPDYLRFMREYNGGEGPVGEENYLCLFRLEEIPAYNQACSALDGTSGFIIFASDGGNTVYAFRGTEAVVEFDLIGLTPEEALYIAEDFTSFLAALSLSDSD